MISVLLRLLRSVLWSVLVFILWTPEKNVCSAGARVECSIRSCWLMVLLSSSVLADFLSSCSINSWDRRA